MSLGVYVHIPYCLQRCTYCDFATYVQSEIAPPDKYVQWLKTEIRLHRFFEPCQLSTVYFGGGTPSLLEPELILSILDELEKNGFVRGPGTEVTIEINPATVTEDKLEKYLNGGINRFSVGAQTFDDRLLRSVNREHSSKQTLETLALLSKYRLNFSFDILFALPGQRLEGLRKDLDIALEQGAAHISPYCLTVPDRHPLSHGRPPEEEQIEMFQLIDQSLSEDGFFQYEISNYAKPGFESRHNLLYWSDKNYWGLGLSAHSYLKTDPPKEIFGVRFWNPNSIGGYQEFICEETLKESPLSLPKTLYEALSWSQSLTDYCHTSLRLDRGLDIESIETRWGLGAKTQVLDRMQRLSTRSWVQAQGNWWRLTSKGRLLSNQVFSEFLF